MPKLRPSIALALALAASGAHAAAVRGKVAILAEKGKHADPSGAVVWLDKLPAGTGGEPAGRHVVATKGKTFRPRVLVVTAGSTVAFPNADPILHNVFSVSGGNAFDLGLYKKGPGREVVLREPGVVRVYCNVHAQMAAFIVVAPSGHFARVAADGAFEIANAPPGRYEVVAWDERGGTASTAVEVAPQGVVETTLELDARPYRREAHLNMHGESYPTDVDDY